LLPSAPAFATVRSHVRPDRLTRTATAAFVSRFTFRPDGRSVWFVGRLDALTMDTKSLRDMSADALRYWERRRIAYNLLLAAVVIVYFIAGWPQSRGVVTLDGALSLFLLAVLANVAYCTAYLADIFLQLSAVDEQRRRWRTVLLLVGFTFAAVLTRFFAMGFVHLPAA
jgi:hypothetical protein